MPLNQLNIHKNSLVTIQKNPNPTPQAQFKPIEKNNSTKQSRPEPT